MNGSQLQIRRLVVPAGVLLACGALLIGQTQKTPAPSATAMQQAAAAFLESLSDPQREQATFSFNDEERLNWHFIPRERKGVPLSELEGGSLDAAHALIASGLSDAGYDQALNIMSLEELLYLLEGGNREERRSKRDPDKYFISVFGQPGPSGDWGWRVEGHHLSLNYTIRDGVVTSSTPEFFGANPGTVDAGPGRAIRVLGPEEDMARQILKLCSKAQQKKAWISQEAPRDIRGGGVAQPVVTEPEGLPFSEMNDDQRKMLGELLAEYLKNMPQSISNQRRAEIRAAGMDKIYFAWWGSSELNEPHYYRVQGPTFIVEYNNVQNSANHVHSIWRNLDGDFALAREK